MVDSFPSLLRATPELQNALKTVEEASKLHSSANPDLRNRAHTIFMQVRHDPQAVDFACYAISEAQDAFVLFQAFQAILDNIATLSLERPTERIATLTSLRDFILAAVLARSSIDETALARGPKSSSSSTHSWSDKRPLAFPKYVQKKAYDAFATVEKRLLGLEVEAAYQRGNSIEETINAHTRYITHDLASLLELPIPSLPHESEEYGSAQSKFTVGVGVMNALLDQSGTATTHFGKEGEGSQTKGSDVSGLLPLQRRWCKAIIQTFVLPGLLTSSSRTLLTSMQGLTGTTSTGDSLFSLIVTVVSRIYGWTFIVEEPFAGLQGPLPVERQTALLRQDEGNGGDQEDDVDDKVGGAPIGRPMNRMLPTEHAEMISSQLVSILHQAYRYAETLEKHRDSQAFFVILELRRILLDLASFRLASSTDSGLAQVSNASKQSLLQCIVVILTTEQENIGAPHDGSYAKRLLFVAQLFHGLLTASSDRQNLLDTHSLNELAQSLSALTDIGYQFAFEPRRWSDEEEDLVQLGDETVDNILACWRALLPYSYEGLHDASAQIFQNVVFEQAVRPYVEKRLLSLYPSGGIDEREKEESEVGQEAVTDMERYEQQLIVLASIARDANLPSCLALLHTLTSTVVSDLQTFYQLPVISVSDEQSKKLESLWEQAHWMALIVGHVLADQSKGEVAVLAQEISSMDADGQGYVTSLIQLIGFTLLDVFCKPSSHLQSPRVTETLLWFNARWIPVYLLVNTTPALSREFDGQAGQSRLQYLLQRSGQALDLWKAEADVVLQIAAIVKSFSLSEGVMRILLGLEEFQHVIKGLTGGLDALPAKTHGPIISAMIGCIYSSSATQEPERFFGYITHAIQSRMHRIVQLPNFSSSRVAQQAEVIASLLNVLDMLDGLAGSVQPRSAVAVYDFLAQFFETLVGLVQLYRERNEVVISILRIYRTLVASLDLGFGAQPYMVTGLNTAVASLLTHIDERSLLGDSPEMALEEDVPFEGLILIIALLSDLMQASDNDAADVRTWLIPLSPRLTPDVCLQGFSRVTEFLSQDARSVAAVRKEFANVTSKLWLSFPHRILGIAAASVSLALFRSCVTALTISLGFVESSLVVDCFTAIQQSGPAVEKVLNMANSASSSEAATTMAEGMSLILNTLLTSILIEPLATSLLDSHLLAIKSLLLTLASDRLGGKESLERRLAHYCETTSLLPAHARSSGSGNASSIHTSPSQGRRAALSHVVIQLATLSVEGSNASRLSAQGRQEEADFLRLARQAAWEGRARIRADG